MERKCKQRTGANSQKYNSRNNPYWKSKTRARGSEKGRKLFIGGLSLTTTSKTVGNHFKKYGSIKEVRLVGELKDRPRGYGFVVFDSEESLLTALCYEHIIDGRVIDCSVALDPKKGQSVDNWP